MACNVFGTPVTDATLKGMTDYQDKRIRHYDKACAAMAMKNAEGKDIDARNFVDKLQESIDWKGVRCLIYNATGGPLTLVAALEYDGCISMSPYPSILQNGQWGAFVHQTIMNNSSAVIVYEGPQETGAQQWALSWSHSTVAYNKCYAEFQKEGYFSMNTSDDIRKQFKDRLDASKIIHTAKNGACLVLSSIGNTTFPIYESILTTLIGDEIRSNNIEAAIM